MPQGCHRAIHCASLRPSASCPAHYIFKLGAHESLKVDKVQLVLEHGTSTSSTGGCVFYSAYMPRGGAWKCTGPRMVPVLEK